MSLAIENLKFTIFGSGWDDTRNDSGKGNPENIVLDFTPSLAVFDETGKYCWVVVSGELKKLDTHTWEEVEQTTIPSSCTYINHPMNVSNNIGIAKDGDDLYLFDLTSDEIINTSVNSFAFGGSQWDCVIDNDVIKMVSLQASTGLDTNKIFKINVNDMTSSNVEVQRAVSGFLDNDSCLGARRFSFESHIHFTSVDSSGNFNWDVTALSMRTVIGENGFTGHGKAYIPTKVDNVWMIGEFDTSSQYANNTPTKTFGEFETEPIISNKCYTSDRSLASFVINNQLWTSDFSNLTLTSEQHLIPLAMTEDMIFCREQDTQKAEVVFMR